MVSARRGFTIAEMVVTLAVISVIAFLGALAARAVLERGNEQVATANAQAVIAAQRDYLVRYGTFAAGPGDLGEVRGVVVVNDASRNRDEVSIAAGSGGSLGVAVAESADRCVLFTVASPRDGGGLSELSAGANTLCIGQAALPDGEAVVAVVGS